MGVATTFLPADVDPATVATPYALLDKFNDDASAQTADIMKEAGMFRLDLVLAGVVFSIGSVVFLCIGLFVVTLAKLFLTFVIAVGPLFILCLAWRPTARFFDSWLSMVLNAVVLTWFAFFALGLSTYMGVAIFKAILDGGGFLGGAFNVLGEATRYCVLMILMAIICFQAPSLASALTGGAAVQQGVQIVQNAMMASGLRSASSARGAGVAGAAGGVVRAGAGLPHAAGRATGAAAASGRFAGTMAAGAGAAVRQGYGAARTAAYRLRPPEFQNVGGPEPIGEPAHLDIPFRCRLVVDGRPCTELHGPCPLLVRGRQDDGFGAQSRGNLEAEKCDAAGSLYEQRIAGREAAALAWSGRSDPDGSPFSFHGCKQPLNYAGYCDAETEKLLALSRRRRDPAERRKTFEHIAARVLKERPVIYVYHRNGLWAYNAKLSGVRQIPDALLRVTGLKLAP